MYLLNFENFGVGGLNLRSRGKSRYVTMLDDKFLGILMYLEEALFGLYIYIYISLASFMIRASLSTLEVEML